MTLRTFIMHLIFSYRPHSSRAVRLDGGRHGTVFWRISCLLSGREEHLRTFLCLLLQVRRAENIWHRLSIVRLESGIVSHAPVIILRTSRDNEYLCCQGWRVPDEHDDV